MPGLSSPIHSPFKFLDPYRREDGAIFFGRREEVETLYQYVNKNRLVLVYGQSGTGKTSVVQCGLANRFEATEWMPFFIRRGDDINASFYHTLSQSGALKDREVNAHNLHAALEELNNYYLRRVYLIFDQFEELLILGGAEEQRAFVKSVQEIMQPGQKYACSLLFILREEYFAWLDPFEKEIPGFSNRRLRIEPMRPKRLEEVVIHSCKAFNITLESPLENAQQAIGNLRGKGGVSLPYLQVYLDWLWRESFARSYPDGWKEEEGRSYPALTFSAEEIEKTGGIRNVLDHFVEERCQAIQQELERAFPGTPPNVVRLVLDAFVTEEGTKRPIAYRRKVETLAPEERTLARFPDISPELLNFCLASLEQSRLLRTEEDVIELAHDSLALIIDQQRSEEQRQLNALRRRLDNLFLEYENSGALLNQQQLEKFEDNLGRLAPDEQKMAFIDKSRQAIQAEARRLKEQAEEERKLRKKAEESLKLAEEALSKLNAFFFEQADGLIHRLEHKAALEKLVQFEAELKNYHTVDIGSTIASLIPRLLELAYFYNEAMQAKKAIGAIELAAGLGKKPLLPGEFDPSASDTYKILRQALREKSGRELWEALEKRYYPEMIFIRGGAFIMGNDNITGASPAHEVALDDFYLASTPTTFWQFGLFCESTGRDIYRYAPSWGLNGDNPAVLTNWFDAMKYANWLNERQGFRTFLAVSEGESSAGEPDLSANGYRLPSEAEWEYAARGGSYHTPGRFSGGDLLREVGWYMENAPKRTQPVARLKSNALGLYDMSGNVWEWCIDIYSKAYYGDSPPKNPMGPSPGQAETSHRVKRGGAWTSFYESCQATYRSYDIPRRPAPLSDQGFRLARPAR